MQYILNPSSNGNSTVQVVNSTFESEFNTPYGVQIYVTSLWSFSIQFEQCNFKTSLYLNSSNPNTWILINNSIFSVTGCCSGIKTRKTAVNIQNCSFGNYAGIIRESSSIYVASSTFSNIQTSALSLYDSDLILSGNINFTNNNMAQGNGGALLLSYSNIIFKAPVDVSFINNSASFLGGAIYILKNKEQDECNVLFDDPNGTETSPGVHIYFSDNNANAAGDILYGGDFGICTYDCSLSPNYCTNNVGMTEKILAIATSCKGLPRCGNDFATNPSMISSDSQAVCSCTNTSIDCFSHQDSSMLVVYPGQTIFIPIATVGQLYGTSPDIILSYTCDVSDTQMNENCTAPSLSGKPQQTTKYCSNFSYQVLGYDNQVKYISVHLLSKTVLFSQSAGTGTYSVFLKVSQCPFAMGFIWNNTTKKCDCNYLIAYGANCDINTLTVSKTGSLWIGNSSSGDIAVHTHCPFDYCNPAYLNSSLVNQDEQCNYNRSGVLCGGCKANLSAVFGSAQCRLCTNHYIWLLIPILVIGVVLMALVFLLNCTVSVGTFNGLILYANIIRPGIINLLPITNKNGFERFLLVFIDWLNLDLGIETCFYDGMDVLGKTWLQLLFPLYILALIGTVIIGSRRSSKLAWLSKRNAVPVLATLILLTFTKVFQTVAMIFSFTNLQIAKSPPVWLGDSNILYVRGKHVYLFIIGLLVTAVFIIPYTSILLLAPWLQAKSHFKILHWVNKFKPFIDAYQAPFKDQYRYWPGVHLMMRVVLYLVFTTNQINDISVNLLACAVVGCIYCTIISFFSVYKNWLMNILETIFWINLVCLSISMLYVHSIIYDRYNTIIMISTGCSFIMFIAIAAFHFHILLKNTVFKGIVMPNSTLNFLQCQYPQAVPEITPLDKNDDDVLRETIMDYDTL